MKTERNSASEFDSRLIVELFVCCLVDSEWQAMNIVARLRAEGFSNHEISVLFPSRRRPESIDSDTSIAANILECGLGGFRTLEMAPCGSILGAGPLMAALNHRRTASIDDISGPLSIFGVSLLRAKAYAQQLFGGVILIAIHSDDLGRAKRAECIFNRLGATDIAYAGSLVSSPETEGADGGRIPEANFQKAFSYR
jgi:hypothetical protein